ncbi:hypothetical protein D3C81_1731690 [compost metagenome]
MWVMEVSTDSGRVMSKVASYLPFASGPSGATGRPGLSAEAGTFGAFLILVLPSSSYLTLEW